MLKLRKKLVVAFIASIIATSSLTLTAFAENKNYSFSLSCYNGSNGAGFSAGNKKDDNDQFSVVYTTNGNINSDDRFYFASYSNPVYSEYYRGSGWKRVNSNQGKYRLDFFSSKWYGQGAELFLCGDTDRHYVQVEGYWYS